MKIAIAAIVLALAGTTVPVLCGAQPIRPVNWLADVTTLDPHQGLDLSANYFQVNLYDTLYRHEDDPAVMQPWLARSHTMSADGKVWEFKLRDGVKFHDGSPLTAEDVVYSFQRAIAIRRGAGALFAPILKPENIVALDPLTVRFTLDSAFGPFLNGVPTVSIVNARLVRKNTVGNDWGAAWLGSNEAGSGAYTLAPGSFKPSAAAELRRFDGHFLGWADNPRAPNVVYARPFGSSASAAMAVISGSADVTNTYMEGEDIDRIQASRTAVVKKNDSMRNSFIHINNTKPPLDNKNFRKCLSYAFNYDAMGAVFKNTTVRNPTPLPTGMWGIPSDVKGYTYDLKKAKEFCDKARAEGAPVDRELDFYAMATIDAVSVTAQLYQGELQKIGVKLKVITQPWSNIIGSTAKPESSPDLWMSWIAQYYPDPDNWLGQTYDSAAHGSWRGSAYYKNAKVDDLLRKARGLQDQAQRAPLYEQAVRQIVDDAPAIWVFKSLDIRGMSKRVEEGYRYSSIHYGNEMRWLKVKN
ncbi:MAG: ABC transporter substrate-binding protein [Pseudomonadota bacterium]